MAKARKKIKRKKKQLRVVIDKDVILRKVSGLSSIKPHCFGQKETYCTEAICGEWFSTCYKLNF